MTELPLTDRLRLDKWLWAARFHKTRGLAADEVERGRVRVNGQACKPARELKAGDRVEIRQDALWRAVEVLALSAIRGPAPLAQTLYRETPESLAARAAAAEARRLAPEPAASLEQGRPTKRQRRDWDRWSASIDDD
jgi:ribosome-associated heat shock protein Hsp15